MKTNRISWSDDSLVWLLLLLFFCIHWSVRCSRSGRCISFCVAVTASTMTATVAVYTYLWVARIRSLHRPNTTEQEEEEEIEEEITRMYWWRTKDNEQISLAIVFDFHFYHSMVITRVTICLYLGVCVCALGNFSHETECWFVWYFFYRWSCRLVLVCTINSFSFYLAI